MSHTRRDIYRCDRCGDFRNMPTNEQPQGWHRVIMSSPVLAHPFEADKARDRMLCAACSEEIDRWIRDASWTVRYAPEEGKSTS